MDSSGIGDDQNHKAALETLARRHQISPALVQPHLVFVIVTFFKSRGIIEASK